MIKDFGLFVALCISCRCCDFVVLCDDNPQVDNAYTHNCLNSSHGACFAQVVVFCPLTVVFAILSLMAITTINNSLEQLYFSK